MGKKDKQRKKLRNFTKLKERQSEISSENNEDTMNENAGDNLDENTLFLKPIRIELLQDPSFELPGFIAAELEESEQIFNELHSVHDSMYGSIPIIHPVINIVDSKIEDEISPTRLKIIMLSMYLGIFLAALDNTIVSTLLAHISSEFDSLSRISWIATAYLLSSATFQPLYGKISDIFGRKIILLFCNVTFFVGCLICGISPSFWWLVIGRFIAGIGGGGITSMSSITTSDIVPLRNRALYQGICNFYFGLGTALGGIVGGWFSENRGGWRMAFIIQLPLALISTVLINSYLILPAGSKGNGLQSNGKSRTSDLKAKVAAVDWIGAISLVSFLLFFLLAASLGGNDIAFSSSSFLTLCFLAILGALLFCYVELKVAKDPILPLRFLKDRSVLGSSLSNWFCMMALMTISYYLPLYFASVLNMKPTDIGKRMIPNFFSTAFGSLGAGYYMKKTGKYYWFVFGFCIVSIIGVLQIFFINPSISVWRQYSLTFIPGLGVSVLITVALLSMIAAVPHKHQAVTTSISYAFRSTGCTLGVSVGAAIFRQSLDNLLYKDIMKLKSKEHSEKELLDIILKASESTEWVHQYAPEFVKEVIINCYHYSCKNVFLFCLICSIATLISISIIKEHKLHDTLDRETEEEQ